MMILASKDGFVNYDNVFSCSLNIRFCQRRTPDGEMLYLVFELNFYGAGDSNFYVRRQKDFFLLEDKHKADANRIEAIFDEMKSEFLEALYDSLVDDEKVAFYLDDQFEKVFNDNAQYLKKAYGA